MNKIFTLLASFLVVTMAMAQKPTAEFDTVHTVAPVLDGVIDDEWDNHTEYKVEKDYNSETPTVNNSYFKACWADSGIFVLVYADDDVHYSMVTEPGHGQPWTLDHVEVYFDVNDGNLEDAKGCSPGSNAGHYQFAPNIDADADGTMKEAANGSGTPFKYSILVEGAKYTNEYFIPFTSLVDENSTVMAQTAEFGFDICIIDRDASDDEGGKRDRKMWSNNGDVNENWNNMDDAGTATLLGAEELIYVDEINLTAPATTIDVNNGTIQLEVGIVPADATIKNVKWIVEPANLVSISNDGLVRAIRNGVVTIMATSTDGGYTDSDPMDITITNQILTQEEDNYIKNGDFSDGLNNWGGGDWTVVEEGVLKLNTGLGANIWDQQLWQNNLGLQTDTAYVLKLKLWADANNRKTVIDLEDPANDYYRFCSTTHEASADGRSQWEIYVTTEPTWYEFDIIADGVKENSDQNFKVLASTSDTALYMDSVYINPKSGNYGIEEPSSISKVNATEFNVYPNPVGTSNVVRIQIEGADTEVALYNMVGQMVESKLSEGSVAQFNVSKLPRGIYMVRLQDGSSRKFVR